MPWSNASAFASLVHSLTSANEAAALSPSFVFLLRGPAAGRNGWPLDDMFGFVEALDAGATCEMAKCFAHSMLRPLKAARLRSKSTPGNWERQWMVFKRQKGGCLRVVSLGDPKCLLFVKVYLGNMMKHDET